MSVPHEIDIDRRLLAREEFRAGLLADDRTWCSSHDQLRTLRRLLYPAFRVEYVYEADGTRRRGVALLDGLRAGNDEALATAAGSTDETTTIDPWAAYDVGETTFVLGFRCPNERAVAALSRCLSYATDGADEQSLAAVRRRYDLPDAVTQESFLGVVDVQRVYLPFWIAEFESDREDTACYIAFRPPEGLQGPAEPVEWMSDFVATEQSLIADAIVTREQPRTDVGPGVGEPASQSAGQAHGAASAGGATTNAGSEARGAGGEATSSDGDGTGAGSDVTPAGGPPDDEGPTGESTAGDDERLQSSTSGAADEGAAGEQRDGGIVQPAEAERLEAEAIVEPVPERGFEDVGGMAGLKDTLRSAVIEPVLEPDRYEAYGLGTVNGVLLHGPPGCGKTYVAGALAGELGRRLLAVSPADLTSKYVGEPAEKVADCFAIACANQPCVVFLDEIDGIAGDRSEQESQSQQQLVNQLLTELEAVDDEEVLVIGATNLTEDVDPAIRRSGRFDERIEVPPPDADARQEILEIHLADRPLAEDLSLSEAVQRTAGYAASDLERLADEAARVAMEDHSRIETDDLLAAVERTDTSIGDWVSQYDGLVGEIDDGRRIVQPDEAEQLDATRLVDREVGIDFDAVGGMPDLEATLREEVIQPITQAERFEEYGLGTVDGVLLYGPPGCGKTYLTRALAGELDRYFIEVSPADLTSKYVGEPAEKVADCFAIARANQPCVVFIDEIDGVAGNRSDQQTTSQQQLVNQLLTELEAIADEEIVVIGATNRIDEVDPAIRRSGRFDRRIEVPPPDADARREILGIHLADRPSGAAIDWGPVLERTTGYAASDVELVADRAARHALRNAEAVTTEHLLAAIEETESSLAGTSWERRLG